MSHRTNCSHQKNSVTFAYLGSETLGCLLGVLIIRESLLCGRSVLGVPPHAPGTLMPRPAGSHERAASADRPTNAPGFRVPILVRVALSLFLGLGFAGAQGEPLNPKP